MRKEIYRKLILSAVLVAFPIEMHASDECVFKRVFERDTSSIPNPPQTQTFFGSHFNMEINALLLQRGDNGTIPELAKTFVHDPTDNSITVTLDKSCKWSDGHDITAKDYIKSFEMIFDPSNVAYIPGREFFKNGDEVWKGKLPFSDLGIEALDENTLKFDITVNKALIESLFNFVAFAPAPSHILEDNPGYWDDYGSPQISSGPYYIDRHEGNTYYLKPNPFYCEGRKPDAKEVIIELDVSGVDEANAAIEGELDMLTRVLPLQAVQLKEHPEITRNFVSYSIEEEVLYYVVFSVSDEAMSDLEVREAISKAIDVSFLANSEFGYFKERADSLAFRYPGYNPDKFPYIEGDYATRLEEAQATMKELGYGPDNILTIDLLVPSRPIYKFIGSALESMLSQIYIKVNFINVKGSEEWRAIAYDPLGLRYDIMLGAWGSDYPDPENFLSSFVNRLRYSPEVNAELIDLMQQANIETDVAKRFDILETVEKRIVEEGYIMPIAWRNTLWMLNSKWKKNDGFYFLARNMMQEKCRE